MRVVRQPRSESSRWPVRADLLVAVPDGCSEPGSVARFDEDPTERLATQPLRDAVESYRDAEVHPYVPDARVDRDKTRIGYEIPLTRQFYKYVPPRPLAEIDAEIKALEEEIQRLLRHVTT